MLSKNRGVDHFVSAAAGVTVHLKYTVKVCQGSVLVQEQSGKSKICYEAQLN